MRPSIRIAALSVVALVAALGLAAREADAQSGDGYLFRAPALGLKFETGYGWQRASSEIYDWVIQEYTIGRRDFDGPYVGGELGVRLSEQVDLAVSVGYQAGTVDSEYRDWVDTDDLPILQTTRLQQVPVSVNVKFYPVPRGRQIGRFAWVPRTVTPFVGAGVGWVSWDFEQVGDFIDFDTFDIFADQVVSDGTAYFLRASAGVDVSLGGPWMLTLESRMQWADDVMRGEFVGFDPIDLDGIQLVGGISVRF